MQTLAMAAMGIGLAAAAGFRVFLPLLALSLASRGGLVPLAPGFEWLGTPEAVAILSAATLIEVAAYAIPGLDHLLDALATPLALIAAVVLSAGVLTDLPPVLKWSLVVIAGGAAGLVQASTVLLRLKLGALTFGLANWVIWAVELFGAAGAAVLALTVPLLGVLLLVAASVIIVRTTRRLPVGRRRPPQAS